MSRGFNFTLIMAFAVLLTGTVILGMVAQTGIGQKIETTHTNILHLSSVQAKSVLVNLLGANIEVGGTRVPAHYAVSQCLVDEADYCDALETLLDGAYGDGGYSFRISGGDYSKIVGGMIGGSLKDALFLHSGDPDVGKMGVLLFQ